MTPKLSFGTLASFPSLISFSLLLLASSSFPLPVLLFLSCSSPVLSDFFSYAPSLPLLLLPPTRFPFLSSLLASACMT
jgi:hypothetical protein